MAVIDAMGLLGDDAPFVHESLIGTRSAGRVAARTRVGEYPAIVPEIEGSAWITGEHTFVVDDSDPLRRIPVVKTGTSDRDSDTNRAMPYEASPERPRDPVPTLSTSRNWREPLEQLRQRFAVRARTRCGPASHASL